MTLSPDRYHAVIFDMDGVITQTAGVHAAAWKALFDAYLKERDGADFVPFDEDKDYTRYVDGKPRYKGVQSFLEARGIDLPFGTPGDSEDTESCCGLGNRKNRYFLKIIEDEGVKQYDSSVKLLDELKAAGIKVGLITSSKNCRTILKAAHLESAFEVALDGVYAEKHGIEGKPAPDIFLEAAHQLGVTVDKAVVVEDALSGVAAGKAGGFALVIGVDRAGQAEELKESGADVVVPDLDRVAVEPVEAKKEALKAEEEIKERLRGKTPVFFLDYDGTLTPIVSRPEQALLAAPMRKTLEALSKRYPVAVISGRDLQNVRELVGVDSLCYAGSHGFDILEAGGERFENPEAQQFVPAIDAAEEELERELKEIDGALVERKKFSVAAHYRLVAPGDQEKVAEVVDKVHHKHRDLRKTRGKMVFELQPKVEWNKGKAVFWLLEKLGLEGDRYLPLFIGDDLTDEDAFKALSEKGIGIAVQDPPRPTAAPYLLKSPEEVEQFFRRFQEGAGE